MIPDNTSVEWPKTETWAWAKGFMLFISFTYLRQFNAQNNIVSKYISNRKSFLPAV
jgi:hypothetical protein